jgi:RNA polymerase sigma-70 factor (ECF subfamily)
LVITRSAARAEDAVHDAICGLLGGNHRPADLKAYVFRAVRNAAVDQVRRRARGGEPLPDSVLDPAPQPGQTAEEAEFRERVAAALERLSADERETVVQHLYGELTFEQIAAVRDAPLGTVASWYRRGIEKLRAISQVSDGSL